QALTIGRAQRAALKDQLPAVLWLTGLSGAGKSTIADIVEKRLLALGRHTMLLDGDNVRHGLNRDLGFTDADRVENIRRVGEVARLMTEAGLIVICSFISPFRAERRMVRELTAPIAFLEIFVDTPLDECIRRDPKGLYAAATKSGGTLVHGLNRNVDWRIVGRLAIGSVPATALTMLALSVFGIYNGAARGLITAVLSGALAATAAVLIFRNRILTFFA